MIATLRAVVHDLLKGAPVPLYQWLPAGAEELPCFVVGRPNVGEGSQRAIVEITIPVFILGRTLRDDEAQRELDDLADVVLNRLWTPPKTEGVSMRLTTLTASVIEVGGLDIPAYTASVIATTAFC